MVRRLAQVEGEKEALARENVRLGSLAAHATGLPSRSRGRSRGDSQERRGSERLGPHSGHAEQRPSRRRSSSTGLPPPPRSFSAVTHHPLPSERVGRGVVRDDDDNDSDGDGDAYDDGSSGGSDARDAVKRVRSLKEKGDKLFATWKEVNAAQKSLQREIATAASKCGGGSGSYW